MVSGMAVGGSSPGRKGPGADKRFQRRRGGARRRKQVFRRRWAWIEKILSWAGDQYFGIDLSKREASQQFRPILHRLQVVVDARGLEGSLEFFSETRTSFLQDIALLGTDGEVSALNRISQFYGRPFMLIVQKLKDGKPDAINAVRFVLTALSALRFVRGKGDPDFGPLTAPFSGQGWDREEVKRLASGFWEDLKVSPKKFRKEVEWIRYHVPHGAGPNGPGALWHAPQDLVTLLKGFPDVWRAVLENGGEALRLRAETFLEVLPRISGTVPCEPGIGARVASIPDKGGKVRVIALGNY